MKRKLETNEERRRLESQLPQITLHARVENASDTNLSQMEGDGCSD